MGENTSRRRDRQIVRVLWLLKALSEGRRVSVPELAKRFGARRETIYRDLHTLEDIGYPIQGDEDGRLSWPRLLDAKHASAPELRLSPEECSALVCLIQHGATAVPLRKELTAAETKLRAMQESPRQFDQVFSSSHSGQKRDSSNEQIVTSLVKAILMQRRCLVTYRAPNSERAKTYQYDPYRLRAVAGGLYCLGQIPALGDLTTLATDRILSLKVTAHAFSIPPDLDLTRCENEAFGVTFEEPMTVTVRFHPDQAPYIAERVWHGSQTLRELPDGGGLELTFRAGGTFEIERWILGWGEAAEVIAPSSLRDSIRSKCEAMSSLYKRAERQAERPGH